MAKTEKDFIRRGDIYRIIQDTIRSEDVPLTFDNMKFMQKLIERAPRWPDSRVMTQKICLDSDLVLKESMIDAMLPYRTTDDRIRIIQKITDEINNS